MKKSDKKLTVNKQTIRVLSADGLEGVLGGWIRPPITWSCPQPGHLAANSPTEIQ